MSRVSSVESLTHTPTTTTIAAEHVISLVDLEADARNAGESEALDTIAENHDSEASTSQPPTPSRISLTKKATSSSLHPRESLQRRLTERRYAKYTQDRYTAGHDLPQPPDEDPASQPQHGEPANNLQKNYLERGKAKVKALRAPKRHLGQGKDTDDMVLDVLYENQRGFFFFGVPKYSASSLLPSDPRPWQNAQFRTSPVDIRNAQLPDPSWEWDWKSWYVDMSRDVDEEGWEYSLKFLGSSSWHGNHPWFHSFVRRRRWLRLRRRRILHHDTKEKSHELTADYFTIHPLKPHVESESGSAATKKKLHGQDEGDGAELPVQKMEVTNIPSLMRALGKATVDREKLTVMRNFIESDSEDLHYLPEHMSQIMALFIYQSSRRQLLADLLRRYNHAQDKRQSLQRHVHENDEETQKQHDSESRHAENLVAAVQAADEQVKKLDYWSDIKGMTQAGQTLRDTEDGDGLWTNMRWAGLASSAGAPVDAFASKQRAKDGAPQLHKHAEHTSIKGNESSRIEPEQSFGHDRVWSEGGTRLLDGEQRSSIRRQSRDQAQSTNTDQTFTGIHGGNGSPDATAQSTLKSSTANEDEQDKSESSHAPQNDAPGDNDSRPQTKRAISDMATVQSLFPGAIDE